MQKYDNMTNNESNTYQDIANINRKQLSYEAWSINVGPYQGDGVHPRWEIDELY